MSKHNWTRRERRQIDKHVHGLASIFTAQLAALAFAARHAVQGDWRGVAVMIGLAAALAMFRPRANPNLAARAREIDQARRAP